MKSKLNIILAAALCVWVTLMMGFGISKMLKGGAVGTCDGEIIGHQSVYTPAVYIEAAVDVKAWDIIGNEMDMRAAEMRQNMRGGTIERVGEGIKITSSVLFDVNKSDLRPQAKTNIESLAEILKKYTDTNILVEGHTDNTESKDYNQQLSECRALSVATYLTEFGVPISRISTIGMGDLNPGYSNDTEHGRQQNRRVEVAILPNEKMKKAAEDGNLK